MIDKRIISFIKRHHVMTLATSVDNEPYCSNIFYAYNSERNRFVFFSEQDTQHAQQALANPCVAASIVLETKVVGQVKGVQIVGAMYLSDDATDRTTYLKRFPYAVAMSLELWVLEPKMCKFTDNTLGFGHKLIWKSDE